MKRKPFPQIGFTLLEVLVALVIMGTAVVIVLQLFSSGLRSIHASEELAFASLQADTKMAAILEDPALDEKVWDEVTESGYRFEMIVTETLKERTENLTVKMLEVALTVRWMTGARERALTVRALKVVDRLRPNLPEKAS
jgi:prepilin-type N-terminal cleavage/methylation domain-containing protein